MLFLENIQQCNDVDRDFEDRGVSNKQQKFVQLANQQNDAYIQPGWCDEELHDKVKGRLVTWERLVPNML